MNMHTVAGTSGITETRPLSFVRDFHEVRPVNAAYVERIRAKVRQIGVKPYPLSVTPDGILFGGRHRYEAFKAEGITECLMHVHQPASLDREAIELNRASEDALPMTFVDEAELVWKRQAAGMPLTQVAALTGLSENVVKRLASLKAICPAAWSVVVPTVREVGTNQAGDDGTGPVPTGTVFTEGLLREISPLRPIQQLVLVSDLVASRIDKGKFRRLAPKHRDRNDACVWCLKALGGIGYGYLKRAVREIRSGRYDDDWKEGAAGERLKKLVKSILDEWQKKNNTTLIHGDFYAEVKKIGDASIDAVITDPPYNISTDRIYRLASQSDWNKNFGEWDNQSEAEFVGNIRTWAVEFFRIMKPGTTGFMFVGEAYINIAQALFDAAGFEIKGTFFWCRTNPGTSVTKADFMPAMDYAIQFVKPGEKRTFNYPGDVEGKNYREFPICGGKERLKNAKGDTLHPTQKPEAVIRHLMDIITLPGDLVFDAFMGVGTTGKVARDTGRKFIGIEMDPTYFAAAKTRVEG